MNFTIPALTTERLTLRAPDIGDFEAFAQFRNSDRAKFVGGPYSRAQAFDQLAEVIGHWVLRGYGRWMVADKQTDQPLGIVGLFYPDDWPEPEISWSVFEAGEGKGIAYEAAIASRAYAYDTLGWRTAISCIDSENTRSVALGKRMGAVYESDFDHPTLGAMKVWRHPAPESAS